VVRDIVVSVPSVRKEALDRLLGISHLRNLFDAFKQIKTGDYEKEVTTVYTSIDDLAESRASAYRERIEEETERGLGFGLAAKDFSKGGFKKTCEEVIRLLRAQAGKAKVEPLELSPPARVQGCEAFVEAVKEETDRLRAESPAMRSQQALDEKCRGLDAALSDLLGRQGELKKLEQEKKAIEDKEGTRKAMEDRKGELQKSVDRVSAQLAEISDRINVVDSTLFYLEKIENPKARAACPACLQEIVPEKLAQTLVRFKEDAKSGTGPLLEQRQQEKKRLNELDAALNRLTRLVTEDLPEANRARGEALETLEETLGRKLGDQEDPEVVVTKEIARIGKKIEENRKALASYLQEMDRVEKTLDAVECIGEVLALEEKVKRIGDSRKSEAWARMDRATDRLNQELERVETVKEVVDEVLRNRSQEKIAATRDQIRGVYRKLVDRPDFEAIEIDPVDSDVYAVTGDDRVKLLTFFNQGDMNCAALSIFLALGAGPGEGSGPAFLMLDDPSQSLDQEQKRRLARVLDEAAGQRQVLLSTMDEELYRHVRQEMATRKKLYRLGEWLPKAGPSISEA